PDPGAPHHSFPCRAPEKRRRARDRQRDCKFGARPRRPRAITASECHPILSGRPFSVALGLMHSLRSLITRARGFYSRSGFILNLRRVWLLIVIWAILANLAIATNRDIFFRLSYLIILFVAAAFLWALYSVQSFTLRR